MAGDQSERVVSACRLLRLRDKAGRMQRSMAIMTNVRGFGECKSLIIFVWCSAIAHNRYYVKLAEMSVSAHQPQKSPPIGLRQHPIGQK